MATPTVTDDDQHPSQETCRRFPQDTRLRRFRFTIHARRPGQEAIWRWRDDGMLYGHREAMALSYRLEKEER